jgi:glycosyltransferase involved in cell wall biosynthesis
VTTIIIAAHNEESVLGGCLEALDRGRARAPFEVIVSANGCTDATAQIASERGATVIDRAEPGKASALNAAEQTAPSHPHIFLDADITVPSHAVDALVRALDATSGRLAAVPRRRVLVEGRSWPVKCFYAINTRLPVYKTGLLGRGMIAVSEEGRRRFDRFPTMIADDLFLDSQFRDDEKIEVPEVEVTVEAPYTTRDLLKRLVRVRRGNAAMRAAAANGVVDSSVRDADRWAWFRGVVLPEPRLVFAAVPYLAITVVAALLARRAPRSQASWGRDESTRRQESKAVASPA